ncbi:MAG: class I SAM-dependent methyltransferase [SAR86 cluster bacterium]|jgi:ubiquinone/menaquinone biosynthesis C-methylase UbiE|uniref:Class I SAM-dependent methyltransferase n=1 Tax=SAR86 cluster bacterium TaxID=2030880 RepID=A0A520MCV8_9GAMM|nr:MAG: class I SAM-dependent methyltransferase [SAR86 cluster bacterium]|tara:strand:- start:1301 stop:2005 length:705 start_codon:yes stop_codon:yes gene_type:complete
MLTFDFNKIDIPQDARVLDLGCGEGRHIFGIMEKFPNAYCVGLDLHAESIKIAQEGLEYFESISNQGAGFTMASGYQMPFADSSFDLVVCSEVLEHLINYEDALDEIQRVLKPNGYLLASFPSFWPEKVCWLLSKDYQEMPGGHVRIFKKKKAIKTISSHGFNFITSERFHSLHSPYWWLRCLFWKTQETNILVGWYKKILEKQILERPKYIDIIDKLLNPVLGKSIAMYYQKK